ncbi:MAG: DUF1800 domain-containing protein [Pseudomonadota bacterium]
MTFDPLLAVTRFGLGPSPRHALPRSVSELFDEAAAPDPFARSHPFLTMAEIVAREHEHRMLREAARKVAGTDEELKLRDQMRAISRGLRAREIRDFRHMLVRVTGLQFAFTERLVAFWTDHFSATGLQLYQYGVGSLVAEAIRPHIMGSFAEMLSAVIRHPVMLLYLDQVSSVGENSAAAQRRRVLGLNENLAREVLELHTLGVEGPYTQRDVRELAELFTGLSVKRGEGFAFRPRWAEPGAEEVLGQLYGGPGAPDGLPAIDAALADLAVHPTTAAHLARKLAIHFVSDRPDDALVSHMAARYAAADGDLGALVAAMLEHPASWNPVRDNVKSPLCFVTSALRALNFSPDDVLALDDREIQRSLRVAMQPMGMIWHRPPDPSGWPEEDEAWVTPQAVAARINWAMREPSQLMDELPDPRDLLRVIAGDEPPGELAFAARSAERVAEGVGIVLASPTFQRR